ncbi:hypothetical protein EP7_000339 [Isosphaeraceae bacterium EP7]
MSITQKIRRLATILDELATIDFGYPLGENTISPPRPGTIALLAEAGLSGVGGLADLYSACDGISMPDVHTGYFIKPLPGVLNYDPSSEPLAILLEAEIPVVPLGSTGGGGLFMAERQGGRVLHLPPGPLHSGCYDGRQANVRVVAEDIYHFLDLVIDDAEAFVRDDQRHRYLVDRG